MTLPGEGGVLPVDKPAGPTSHDVVARARRALGERRIGHTGTLDPFATGLLLLCVGPATRLSQYLTGLDKTYLATALLGARTDSDDLDGEIVEESSAWRELGRKDVEEALAGLVGLQRQVPPAFSAKKVAGVAAHRRARRGETVELEPVEVEVHEAELLGLALPEVRFRVRCSSGTYVRSLARDLGERLGTLAHLTALRRSRVGGFDVEAAIPVDRLDDPEAVAGAWVPPARALAHLPAVEVSADEAERLGHGQRVRPAGSAVPADGIAAVVREGALVAVAEVRDGALRPRKVFVGGGAG